MSTIERGRTVTLKYREDAATGKATLVIEISAGSDILPHEHREDTRNVAAELLNVPVVSLDGVEVELKRVPGDHSRGEDGHQHPPASSPESAAPERPKVKS
ncbi:MAG: hypothetical protein AB1938_31940 [Myxococcota bacterium]